MTAIAHPLAHGQERRHILRRILVPDEFALRGWRQFRRPRAWGGLPLGFLIAVAVLSLLLLPLYMRFGLDSEYLGFFVLVVHGAIPLLLPVLILGSWWVRPSTQHTLREIAVSPTEPLRYIRSTLLASRWAIIVLSMLVAILALAMKHDGEGFEASDHYWAAFTLIVQLVQAWYHLPLLLFLLLGSRSTPAALVRGVLLLLPLHWFPLVSVLVVGFEIEIIDSDEGYLLGLGIVVVLEIALLLWMRFRLPVAVSRHMDALVERH